MTKRRARSQANDSLQPNGSTLTDILTSAVMDGPAAVVITNAAGTIEYVNRTFCELTGYAAEEAVGQKASLLKSGLMPESCYRALWRQLRQGRHWTGEFHNCRKNGELYWEQASISVVRDAAGRIGHYLKIAEDLTERKRLEAELRATVETLREHEAELQAACRQLANATRALALSRDKLQRQSQEDALTGLLNRRGFAAETRRLEALAKRDGFGIGVLMIDIDRFKQFNDLCGHAAGDRILKAFASLLRSQLRACDLVCRYGGDELVVALPLSDAESTERTARRLLAAVREHDFSKGLAHGPVSASIGAACGWPNAGQSLDRIMQQADGALYWVKRNGRNGMAIASADGATPAASATRATPKPQPKPYAPLLAMLAARDPETAAHCRRVSRMAAALAGAMKLPPDQIARISQSALVHDIGKIAVPERILQKPGPLTAAEKTRVQKHAYTGYTILRTTPELALLAEAVLCHHERLNGSGYPRGLKGSKIGLDARVLAVADTYDAMRAGRPYAPPRSPAAALRELRRLLGSHFDAAVVAALEACQARLEAVLEGRPCAAEHAAPAVRTASSRRGRAGA